MGSRCKLAVLSKAKILKRSRNLAQSTCLKCVKPYIQFPVLLEREKKEREKGMKEEERGEKNKLDEWFLDPLQNYIAATLWPTREVNQPSSLSITCEEQKTVPVEETAQNQNTLTEEKYKTRCT